MILFARTRWNYDSYVDFWRLVELAGYPTCYVDEIDVSNSDATYIVCPMNGEFAPHIQNQLDKTASGSMKCNIYLWNLERPSGSGGLNKYITDNRRIMGHGWLTDVIVSDIQLSRDTGFKFVPLGSHKGLGMPGEFSQKVYDLIHLSCYSLHRSWLFAGRADKPRDRIGAVTLATNAWGSTRDLLLKQSKFMLNVHQDGIPYIEPLRFALAAAYALPIISEPSFDPHPYRMGADVCFYANSDPMDLNAFAAFVKNLSGAQYSQWNAYGHALRYWMTDEYSFRRCIEEYLT